MKILKVALLFTANSKETVKNQKDREETSLLTF